MTTPLKRYDLRCSHDGDSDFLETDDHDGEWMKAADVEAVLNWVLDRIAPIDPEDWKEVRRLRDLLTPTPAERGD
jgi:hypothetical protein